MAGRRAASTPSSPRDTRPAGIAGTFLADDLQRGGGVTARHAGASRADRPMPSGVPVVAAGGIADGRLHSRRLLTLGAAGVQIGTAYLLCPETATGRRCIAMPCAQGAEQRRTAS